MADDTQEFINTPPNSRHRSEYLTAWIKLEIALSDGQHMLADYRLRWSAVFNLVSNTIYFPAVTKIQVVFSLHSGTMSVVWQLFPKLLLSQPVMLRPIGNVRYKKREE